MENNVNNTVESILSDLNSKNISQKFCEFVSNCLFTTLSNPVRLNDCKNFNLDKLIDLKRKADSQIREDLKKEFNIDLNVSKITSVFEKPSFYNDILSRLTKQNRTLPCNNSKNCDPNTQKSVASCATSGENGAIGPPAIKIYEKECSFKTGHVDLDLVAIQRNNSKFSNNVKSFLSTNCMCSQDSENEDLNHIEPIFNPPITKSQFKLINVNFYLLLSKFCGCCQKRLKDVSILNSLCKENETLESLVTFNNESSLFKPFVRRKNTYHVGDLTTEAVGGILSNTDTDLTLDSSECKGENSSVSKQNLGTKPTKFDLDLKATSNVSNLNDSEICLSSSQTKLHLKSTESNLGKEPSLKSERIESLRNVSGRASAENDRVIQHDLSPSNKSRSDGYMTSKQILNEIYSKYKDSIDQFSKGNLNIEEPNKCKPADSDFKSLMIESFVAKKMKSDALKNCKASDISPISSSPAENKSVRLVSLENISSSPSPSINPFNSSTNSISNLTDNLIPLVNSNKNEKSSAIKIPLILNYSRKKSAKKLAKLLKKDKREKKKLMRAKINLAPPPGVDLDEYLKEQMENIKLQLKNISDNKNNIGTSKKNLDIPDLIKDQWENETSVKLTDLDSTISTVLHAKHDINTRKVIDYQDLAKDFESLPEFETSPVSLKNSNNKGKVSLNPTLWKKPVEPKSARKSIVFKLRNRSRTPQISKNRLRSLKQSTKVSAFDKTSQNVESDNPKVNDKSEKKLSEDEKVIVISDDDELMNEVVSSLKTQPNKSSPSKNNDLNNSKKLSKTLRGDRDSPHNSSDNSDMSNGSPNLYKNIGFSNEGKKSKSKNSKNSRRHSFSKSPEKRRRERRYRSNSKSPYLRKINDFGYSRKFPNRRRTRSKSPYRNRRHLPSSRRRSRSISPRRRSRSISPRRRSRSISPRRRYRSKSPKKFLSSRNRKSRSVSPRRLEPKRIMYVPPSPFLPQPSRVVPDSFNTYDESFFLNVSKAVSPPKDNNPIVNAAVPTNSLGYGQNGFFPYW